MRILFLLTQDIHSPSGLGRYLPLAKGLSELGHQVHLVGLHPHFESLPHKKLEVDGVHVHFVAPMHVRKSGAHKTYYPWYRLLLLAMRATWQLARTALTLPADIIHIAKPHPMNSLAGLAANLFRGRRIVLDCDDYEAAAGSFGAPWQEKVVTFFERWMPHRVSGITTNTHFMAAKIHSWHVPPEKIALIPNPIDPTRFATPKPQVVSALRRRLGLSGKQVVMYVGTMSRKSHAVDVLLEAFPHVLQAEPQSVLLLVGGGEDFEALKRQAEELGIRSSVVFVGPVPPEQVAAYYRLGKVSVDPVRDDDAARGRFPLKMLESWVCALPFISADVGDRQVLLGSPPTGLLAVPGNAEALAQAILNIFSNPRLAKAYVQRGSEQVKAYFYPCVAADLERFYTSLPGGHKTSENP
ncbi:MAG: glycosyltransferase family 4 protein [Chloroflexota bacterium]